MSRLRRGTDPFRGVIRIPGVAVTQSAVGGGGAPAPAAPTPGDGPIPDLVWIDASKETAFADTDTMTTITDFSTRAVASYPLTAAENKCKWRSTAGVNSLPAFEPDALGTKYDLGTINTDWGAPTAWTIFGVMQATAVNFEPFLGTQSEGVAARFGLIYRNTNHEITWATAAANGNALAVDVGARVDSVVSARFTSTLVQVWHNSGGPGSTNPGGDFIDNADRMVTLGSHDDASEWESNRISELLVYGTALSDADLDKVEDYLFAKYNLTKL